MAKSLIECVQCFGQLLVKKKKMFYRGIADEFILKRFVAQFHVPLSTSKSVSFLFSNISSTISSTLANVISDV